MSRKVSRPLAAGTDTVVPRVVSGMSSTRKRAFAVALGVTAVIVLSACGSTAVEGTATVSPTAEFTASTSMSAAPTSTTAPTETVEELVERAVKRSIDPFLEGQLGREISVSVVPFDSAAGEQPTCDGDAIETAGYCPATTKKDTILWDVSELERIRAEGGDLAVAVVMSHEYGHAAEDVMGQPSRGVTAELRAWCMSGAYLAHAEGEYTGDLDTAISAAKPEGVEASDQHAARVDAIEAGRAMASPSACLSYRP